MKKIPVGRTIAHAYRFAFAGFFDLVRLLWLPAAAAALCNYFAGDQMTLFIQDLRTHEFSQLSMPWPLLILVTILAFILGNMQIAATNQLALGQIATRDRLWYFPLLQKSLWRVIGAFLLLVLVLAVLLVIYVLALLAVGMLFGLGFHAAHLSDAAITNVTALDTALAFLAGYCGFIFCATRFGFLLFPATVAEGKIGIARAWQLSHRNFWRMLLIGVVCLLPVIAAEFLYLSEAGAFHLPPLGATPAQIQAIQAATQAAADAKTHHYWYIFYPLQALIIILADGLLAGAQSFAYRALTSEIGTDELATPNPP